MIENYLNKQPKIAKTAKLFSGAKVIGDVTLKDHVGIWYNVVIRADMDRVEIGENTNIQDGAIIHTNIDMPTIIGKNVTVGHGAIIHAATVEDEALIGIGSIILDEAVIGKGALIAAGTIIPPRKKIPRRALVMGNPMKIIKTLSDDEVNAILKNKDAYVKLLKEYQ